MHRNTESERPFTLRKAIDVTGSVTSLLERMPDAERDVLGSQMARYAFLTVGRLSKAIGAPTPSRRSRGYSAARGSVAALSSLLELSVRVGVLAESDVERVVIDCDELLHILGDLAGTPQW